MSLCINIENLRGQRGQERRGRRNTWLVIYLNNTSVCSQTSYNAYCVEMYILIFYYVWQGYAVVDLGMSPTTLKGLQTEIQVLYSSPAPFFQRSGQKVSTRTDRIGWIGPTEARSRGFKHIPDALELLLKDLPCSLNANKALDVTAPAEVFICYYLCDYLCYCHSFN